MVSISNVLSHIAEEVLSAKPGLYNPKELSTEALKKVIKQVETEDVKKRVKKVKHYKQLGELKKELEKREPSAKPPSDKEELDKIFPDEETPAKGEPTGKPAKPGQPEEKTEPSKKVKPTKLPKKNLDDANEKYSASIALQIRPAINLVKLAWDKWFPPDLSERERDIEFMGIFNRDLAKKLSATKITPQKKAILYNPKKLLDDDSNYSRGLEDVVKIWKKSFGEIRRLYGENYEHVPELFLRTALSSLKRAIKSDADVEALIHKSLGMLDSVLDTIHNFLRARSAGYHCISEPLRDIAEEVRKPIG